MLTCRAYHLPDGGWEVTGRDDTEPKYYVSLDSVPPPARDKLSVLMIASVGFRDESIGRRVSDDVYWVF